jgi:hypothetical protein
METQQRFVDEQTVSKLVGRALQTLRNDRFEGKGLPYVKVGRSVRYDLKDVVDYMEQHKIVPQKPL